jgi:4-hydroxyphenylpyruvate dioxygenase
VLATWAGVSVDDATEAYSKAVENGAVGVQPPTILHDKNTGEQQVVCEIQAFHEGDVVLRFVSGTFSGPFLVGYAAVSGVPSPSGRLGIKRIDHMGAAASDERAAISYMSAVTGVSSDLC